MSLHVPIYILENFVLVKKSFLASQFQIERVRRGILFLASLQPWSFPKHINLY